MLNWLLKFGWSHPDPNFDKKHPTLSIDEMISLFNEGNISDRNCKIDKAKLAFLDKKWKSIERRGATPTKEVVVESKLLKFDEFKK